MHEGNPLSRRRQWRFFQRRRDAGILGGAARSRAGPGVEDLSRRRGSKAFPSRAVPCLTFIRRSTANGILVMIRPKACKKQVKNKPGKTCHCSAHSKRSQPAVHEGNPLSRRRQWCFFQRRRDAGIPYHAHNMWMFTKRDATHNAARHRPASH